MKLYQFKYRTQTMCRTTYYMVQTLCTPGLMYMCDMQYGVLLTLTLSARNSGLFQIFICVCLPFYSHFEFRNKYTSVVVHFGCRMANNFQPIHSLTGCVWACLCELELKKVLCCSCVQNRKTNENYNSTRHTSFLTYQFSIDTCMLD